MDDLGRIEPPTPRTGGPVDDPGLAAPDVADVLRFAASLGRLAGRHLARVGPTAPTAPSEPPAANAASPVGGGS